MTAIATVQKLFLKYGKKTVEVASVAEASRLWSETRDRAMREGYGPSDMRSTPWITDADGKILGHVSWNGRVWREPYGSNVEWLDEAVRS